MEQKLDYMNEQVKKTEELPNLRDVDIEKNCSEDPKISNNILNLKANSDSYPNISFKKSLSLFEERSANKSIHSSVDVQPTASSNTNLSKLPSEQAIQLKIHHLKRQLFLLLHALKCSKYEPPGFHYRCIITHCEMMKQVLDHMMNCGIKRECKVPHCQSSHLILQHWNDCQNPNCCVCDFDPR